MAETQDATLGYGGEFYLHNGSSLYKLIDVKEFQIPGTGAREQVESTTLSSPGWRREFLSSFYEDTEFEVLLNTRVLSDTDALLADALGDGDVRPFKALIPENGTPVAKVEGTAKCTGYDRGRVTPDGLLLATATFKVVTVDAAAAV